MKIIERGEIPGEKKYRARCGHCNTMVEFAAGESKSSPDPRYHGVIGVDCPLCQSGIWVSIGVQGGFGGFFDR